MAQGGGTSRAATGGKTVGSRVVLPEWRGRVVNLPPRRFGQDVSPRTTRACVFPSNTHFEKVERGAEIDWSDNKYKKG